MKEFKAIAILILTLFTSESFGQQYKWTGRTYVDPRPVKADERDKLFIKGFGKHLHLFRKFHDSTRYMEIADLNIHTLLVERRDTVKANENFEFKVWDVAASENFDVLVGNSHLYIYDRKTSSAFYSYFEGDKDSIEFNRVSFLNDSLLCLSNVYDYHPFDGFSGLHLHTFNAKSRSMINHRYHVFRGVGLSHMIRNWVIAQNGVVYVVTPLSGLLYRYDENLELLDSTTLPITWSNYSRNLKFETQLDNVIFRERHRLNKLLKKHGAKYLEGRPDLTQSHLDTKNFMSTVSDSVRNTADYVEKIIPYNDSVFILSMSRAKYGFKYRDFYFYNFRQNKIVDSIERWNCAPLQMMSNVEDFFTIDPINDQYIMAYFNDRKAYNISVYNPSLFSPAAKDSVEKIYFKDVRKNRYRWWLLEYSF